MDSVEFLYRAREARRFARPPLYFEVEPYSGDIAMLRFFTDASFASHTTEVPPGVALVNTTPGEGGVEQAVQGSFPLFILSSYHLVCHGITILRVVARRVSMLEPVNETVLC